jgi:hypothetical protein
MYWVAAFLFGAIAPVLVVAFVVFRCAGRRLPGDGIRPASSSA